MKPGDLIECIKGSGVTVDEQDLAIIISEDDMGFHEILLLKNNEVIYDDMKFWKLVS